MFDDLVLAEIHVFGTLSDDGPTESKAAILAGDVGVQSRTYEARSTGCTDYRVVELEDGPVLASTDLWLGPWSLPGQILCILDFVWEHVIMEQLYHLVWVTLIVQF